MLHSGSKMDQMAKFVAMGVGSYLVWYFAGPLTGELGRHAFEGYYYFLHGTPSVFSFEYWLNYLPLRGHTTHYSYKYGDMLFAAISAPFFYKVPDFIRYCFKRAPLQHAANQDSSPDESMDEPANLSHLSELLENAPVPQRRSMTLNESRQLLVSTSDSSDSSVDPVINEPPKAHPVRMHVNM